MDCSPCLILFAPSMKNDLVRRMTKWREGAHHGALLSTIEWAKWMNKKERVGR